MQYDVTCTRICKTPLRNTGEKEDSRSLSIITKMETLQEKSYYFKLGELCLSACLWQKLKVWVWKVHDIRATSKDTDVIAGYVRERLLLSLESSKMLLFDICERFWLHCCKIPLILAPRHGINTAYQSDFFSTTPTSPLPQTMRLTPVRVEWYFDSHPQENKRDFSSKNPDFSKPERFVWQKFPPPTPKNTTRLGGVIIALAYECAMNRWGDVNILRYELGTLILEVFTSQHAHPMAWSRW